MSMANIHKKMNYMVGAVLFLLFLIWLESYGRVSVNNDINIKIDNLQSRFDEKMLEQSILIKADYLLAKKAFKVTRRKHVNPNIVTIMDQLPYLPADKE